MELDFKYQQYNSTQQSVNNNEMQINTNKPYQDVIDYFGGNLEIFNYSDMVQHLTSVNESAVVTLEDGVKVQIGKMNGIVNVAVMFPNGTKFIGSWTNIADDAEFVKQIDKVPR